MADVTLATFDEMEPIYDGVARRARAALGVTAWGMQLFALPPRWDGYPDHVHDATVEDANQEEVYIPLEGSAELWAGTECFDLRPGVMVRVGPAQRRRIVPGEDGIRFIALGGVPDRSRRGGRSSAVPGRSRSRLAWPCSRSPVLAMRRRSSASRRRIARRCYRMLGSIHDADDAMQETMLRAWRAIERFEPRPSLAAWLYRIATNVCLRMIEQRSRRAAHEIGRELQP